MQRKLYEKFVFNFLAKDATNAADIMEAGSGYVIPGIVSDKFPTTDKAAETVRELKSVTEIVSVGLGGGGNAANWKRVLDISLASNPGHLNQPFESASYTKGFLDGSNVPNQLVNALVKPTGKIGKIQLASGQVMRVDEFLDLAVALGIESIKMMPVKGNEHIEELIHLTKLAGAKGIRGIEPAGGIDTSNIRSIVNGVKDIDIEFFMPHIFGATIDKQTGKTIPNKVKAILDELED
ncbi:KDGP aldolase [Virgibacillus ndiopensis]|uniref:KDGP aldolase n=1 Tax=Virgibacillus ndiopensis TaxID=2004408 RepID=UPI000C08C536|nr:KDGP aldolase [Virgibacillus ndiopensis]